jgi:hypothetical protein
MQLSRYLHLCLGITLFTCLTGLPTKNFYTLPNFVCRIDITVFSIYSYIVLPEQHTMFQQTSKQLNPIIVLRYFPHRNQALAPAVLTRILMDFIFHFSRQVGKCGKSNYIGSPLLPSETTSWELKISNSGMGTKSFCSPSMSMLSLWPSKPKYVHTVRVTQ